MRGNTDFVSHSCFHHDLIDLYILHDGPPANHSKNNSRLPLSSYTQVLNDAHA
jgi:hypothetical protein